MKQAEGYFYDGKTSQRLSVTLQFDEAGQLQVLGGGDLNIYPLSKLDISSRLGNTPRLIRLPEGGKCECYLQSTLML
ncbi:MAG: hypothetical protein AAF512_18885, partial [Pseudomonadota bacterium]